MNAEMFCDVYGHAPTVRVFCPGHLNLIGEHIAEHGFGTIAMATDTGTEILGRFERSSRNPSCEHRRGIQNAKPFRKSARWGQQLYKVSDAELP
ncbi:hypothetical protein OSTOST_12891, partial [Ostertagia ostertagi]